MTEYKELWEQDDQSPFEFTRTGESSPEEDARTRRLLLPFIQGIDASAIASALELAQSMNATLVSLSLLPTSGATRKGPRWEDIQASRDFLEFVLHKANRAGIPIERMELHTQNAVGSIRALAHEMECAGIVLIVRQGKGILLPTRVIKQLLEDRRIPLYVVSLPERAGLFSLFRRFKGDQGN